VQRRKELSERQKEILNIMATPNAYGALKMMQNRIYKNWGNIENITIMVDNITARKPFHILDDTPDYYPVEEVEIPYDMVDMFTNAVGFTFFDEDPTGDSYVVVIDYIIPGDFTTPDEVDQIFYKVNKKDFSVTPEDDNSISLYYDANSIKKLCMYLINLVNNKFSYPIDYICLDLAVGGNDYKRVGLALNFSKESVLDYDTTNCFTLIGIK
jgi:hypothetical protein